MSTPFTDADRAFLRGILNTPADLTGWAVYADWLDEKGQPERAEYLRLQVRLGQLGPDDPDRAAADARLCELRASLHPLWVAVFDRPAVENCDAEFAFKCPKQWENLKVTGEAGRRYCENCEKSVYYCHTVRQAREHARRGRCVAVASGLPRLPGDLDAEPEMLLAMGMVRYDPEPVPPPPPRRRPWWKFW